MHRNLRIALIIPALDEAATLPGLLAAIPRWVDDVVVADNGSRDATYDIAVTGGHHPAARAVRAPRRGYGSACLAALATVHADVLVFLDADHSDRPELLARLVDPIADGAADLVLANRFTADLEPGALSVPQRFGNKFACLLVRLLWLHRYRDLGPFRAVRAGDFADLAMRDPDYGWTIELQVKALSAGLRVLEVDLPYRNRQGGRSKVSGTVRGVFGAGWKILWKIAALRVATWVRRPGRRPAR